MIASSQDCFFCRKAAGTEEEPLGGYLHRDREWLVNHAAPASGHAGTLILSSTRHFLDFSDMNEGEIGSWGRWVGQLIRAVKEVTGAERVYVLAMMANQPHFHTWLVPQPAGSPVRAYDLIASRRTCSEADVLNTSERLRACLGRGW